jgi:hypothetical protein
MLYNLVYCGSVSDDDTHCTYSSIDTVVLPAATHGAGNYSITRINVSVAML